MSGRPTLLEPGRLELPGGREAPPGVAPIAYITGWLRRRMPEFGAAGAPGGSLHNRVLVVKAETGSGKSTTLPVAVFRLRRSESTPLDVRFEGPGVICTQPRVLTAISLAEDVSSARDDRGAARNPDMVLGETVGYQTGPLSALPPGGLVYATAGVLAAQLAGGDDAAIMAKYRFIILDEAHERSLDSDRTLMQLRNFYLRNLTSERLPFLLLASATFDPLRYASYFGVGPENVMTVRGRGFEIFDHFPERGTNDYAAEAAEAALRIAAGGGAAPGAPDAPGRGDVLIFAPGALEAADIVERLQAAAAAGAAIRPLEINREVVNQQGADYLAVFAPPDSLRRVIVATVVAETGLTVKTLRYVIDAGWNRTVESYPPWGVTGLVTRPAPRSRIKQRKGRAGRLFNGDFYPLYTQNVYRALDEDQLPEIVTAGVAPIFLSLVQSFEKMHPGEDFDPARLGMLDAPPAQSIWPAVAAATALGFFGLDVAAEGGKRHAGLTALGRLACRFSRASMGAIRVLLGAYERGAAMSDLATAVASFGERATALLAPPGQPGSAPPGTALRRAAPRGLRAGPDFAALLSDDFAETVLIYDSYVAAVVAARGDTGALLQWCAEGGLSLAALTDLGRRREECVEELILAGLDLCRGAEHRLSLQETPGAFGRALCAFKECLYGGLRTNLLTYDEGAGTYRAPSGIEVHYAPAPAPPGPAPAPPRWLVTDDICLKQVRERKTSLLLWRVAPGQVSVLDGHVWPDPEADLPRVL